MWLDVPALSAPQLALAQALHMQLPFAASHSDSRDRRVVATQVDSSPLLSDCRIFKQF